MAPPKRRWVHYILTMLAGLRTIGGSLQLLGIVLVAKGIADLRRDFGLPSSLSEILAETREGARAAGHVLARLVGRRPTVTTVTGVGASASLGISVKGRGTVRSGPGASLSERVSLIEQIVDSLENSVWRLEDTVAQQQESHGHLLEAERIARERADAEVASRVTDFAIGGVRLETIGLIWLTVGTLLSTWSQELSQLYCRLFVSA